MKKTILTISFASSIAFAPITTLAQETVERDVGNRIVQRLDNRGDQINDQLQAKTHQAKDYGLHARSNWLDRKGNWIDRKLDRKGDRINDRLHTKTHRVRGNKRHALPKRLYRNGSKTNNRIYAGWNNQGRDWIRSRNTQRFHRSQGQAQSTRRWARR